MSLATIAIAFDNAAAEELKSLQNEALEALAQTVEVGGETLLRLVNETVATATKLVIALMGDDSLSGLEKANLAATQLVELYALQGITIAAESATFLIKNAYEAAAAYLRSLKS